MDELDEILASDRKEPTTFHPVNERSPHAWYPGNEAASLVIQIGHILEDLLALIELRENSKNGYSKQLLLKYAVIEVRSLIEVFDRLQGTVMKANIFNPRERQGWREITVEEKEKAKELFKAYSEAKKGTSQKVIDIRNTIGAHRGCLNWQQVMAFWDAITPDIINPLLAAIPPAFDFVKELDLFEWNRVPRDGTIEVIGGMLRPEYFEEKE